MTDCESERYVIVRHLSRIEYKAVVSERLHHERYLFLRLQTVELEY